MLPALLISLLAPGFLARDGYAFVTDLVAATVFAVVVSGAIWGVIKGIIFMISKVLAQRFGARVGKSRSNSLIFSYQKNHVSHTSI